MVIVTKLSKSELIDLINPLMSDWGTIMDNFRLFTVDGKGNRYEATREHGFDLPFKYRISYIAIDKITGENYNFPILSNMRVRLMAKIMAISGEII